MSAIKTIRQGGSIGLVTLPAPGNISQENWAVFAPNEVNPGRIHTKRGTEWAPMNARSTNFMGFATLEVYPLAEVTGYQFQVCIDQDCKKIFLDVIDPNSNYWLKKPIPAGAVYYTRARVKYIDGTYSQWGEVRTLTNNN